MGGNNSRTIEIIFQVTNVLLILGFILAAVSGIVLITSTSALHLVVKVAFKGYKGDVENVRRFAALLLELSDTMAICCIVFGMVLALLSLMGVIASCRRWYKMLKIYGIVLGVLLVLQIIGVAVVFSNPTKFANGIVGSLGTLLKSYGDVSKEGKRATEIWDMLMETPPQCCGMDGYTDFHKKRQSLPHTCCNITNGLCDTGLAKISGVKGCRSKIEYIAKLRSATLLYVSITMMFMQALLIALAIITLCAANDEQTMEE